MLGCMYLFDTKLNKTIKIYKNEELYKDNDSEFRLEIKKKYLDKYNNRYSLLCACNSSIEMSIDSIGRIYHKNQADLLKHDKFCERHKDYIKNISKGISETKDGLTVTLNFSIMPNNELKEENKKKIKNDSIDIQDLSKHLNIRACRYKVDNKFDVLNRVFAISKDVCIKGFRDKTLQDFYFSIKEYKKITSKASKFVYMYLSEGTELDNKEYVQLKCEYSQDKYFSFVCRKDLFNKQYLAKYIDDIKNPIVVSGFISKTDKGLEFCNLSLIKVNKQGIY